MLVLSRKKSQSIRIGDDIKIKVIDVKGDRVRIGIDAPADIRVMREELFDSDPSASSESSEEQPSPDPLVAVADGPARDDTLRSGAGRVLNVRSSNWRPSAPR